MFFPGIEQDVGSIYKALGLFVYASLHDTFGMAVVEALLSRKPVVVNDLEVFKEITLNGKLADLYPTNDHEALAGLILQKTLQKKFDEGPYQQAKELYAIEKHFKSLNEIYQKL
ncbi:MAG: glycosyltransferase [Bacteroidetes bacterium]|nr:glycosyltransferase [Bacteroidota bacterium]